MVYTERAETAADSRGTSYVTTKYRCQYTTSGDIQKTRFKNKSKKIPNIFIITNIIKGGNSLVDGASVGKDRRGKY